MHAVKKKDINDIKRKSKIWKRDGLNSNEFMF